MQVHLYWGVTQVILDRLLSSWWWCAGTWVGQGGRVAHQTICQVLWSICSASSQSVTIRAIHHKSHLFLSHHISCLSQEIANIHLCYLSYCPQCLDATAFNLLSVSQLVGSVWQSNLDISKCDKACIKQFLWAAASYWAPFFSPLSQCNVKV